MSRFLFCLAFLVAGAGAAAQDHRHAATALAADAREAFTATPAFAPDGTLWLVRGSARRVEVVRSDDLGRTFSAPVPVTPDPVDLDWGPDARPRIVVDAAGDSVVTFATFQDKRFNGRAFYARSHDRGTSFDAPRPITADATSQRFETAAIDPAGRLFAAWLDKRNAAAAGTAGKAYPGAALAYTWADGGAGFGDTRLALDNACECCRLGIAFAGPGRPAIIFRNVFAGSIRDHAVVVFKDPTTPGPLRRVSVDDWKLEACPHHGPSLAIAADGSYHAAWFTDGAARKGLFYARADNADAPFEPPRTLSSPDRQPARPHLLAVGNTVHLVWKEFDGDRTRVLWQLSRDSGRDWSAARSVADTDDASDHPLLVADKTRVYLSWLTKSRGYRLIPLENLP